MVHYISKIIEYKDIKATLKFEIYHIGRIEIELCQKFFIEIQKLIVMLRYNN